VNKTRTRAFLDSGSTITLASRSLAETLQLSPNPSRAIRVDFVGANGSSLGSAFAEVKIGKIIRRIEIHVFEYSTDDLLFGARDAAKFNLKVDFKNRKLTQDLDEDIVAVNSTREESSHSGHLSKWADNFDLFASDSDD